MASLPTTYASQRFGTKSLDFYNASGDVIGADPRARADERRIQDLEGARHTVRLMESGFRMDPGDQASVLRMQPGPARRSRPVAVVNHTTGAWSRTHPGATGLLARAGVARTANWALTLTLFALAALVVVWPYLRAFLVEVAPSTFAAAPQLDVFALAAGLAPGVAEWRLGAAIAPLSSQIQQAVPALAGYETAIIYGAGITLAAGIVYALRSWRLIWAPLFVGGVGAAAFGFDGVTSAPAAALAGLGAGAGVFLLGGLVNRIRDAARLEQRIAILSDHMLRNAPEEMITGSETVPEAEAEIETEAGDQPAPEPESSPSQSETEPAADQISDDRTVAVAASVSAAAHPSGADAGEIDVSEAEDMADEEPADSKTLDLTGAAELQDVPDHEPAADTAQDGTGDASAPAIAEPSARPDTLATLAAQAAGGSGTTSEEAGKDSADQPRGATFNADAPEALDQETASASGEAEGAPGPVTFEQEESERLRTDPRYAARAIVLPPPPPMPGATENGDAPSQNSGEPSQGVTRTLQPGAPLGANVVPMFTPPAPVESETEDAD